MKKNYPSSTGIAVRLRWQRAEEKSIQAKAEFEKIIDETTTRKEYLQERNAIMELGMGSSFTTGSVITTPAEIDNTDKPIEKRIGHYIDNGNGTVTDTRSGLTWMRCAIGQIWDGRTCQGVEQEYSYHDAKTLHHSFAGHDDWRLPTRDELRSIVDPRAFPRTNNSWFWSSSPFDNDPSHAWIVNFGNGYVSISNLGNNKSVRLVRGGQNVGLLDQKSTAHHMTSVAAAEIASKQKKTEEEEQDINRPDNILDHSEAKQILDSEKAATRERVDQVNAEIERILATEKAATSTAGAAGKSVSEVALKQKTTEDIEQIDNLFDVVLAPVETQWILDSENMGMCERIAQEEAEIEQVLATEKAAAEVDSAQQTAEVEKQIVELDLQGVAVAAHRTVYVIAEETMMNSKIKLSAEERALLKQISYTENNNELLRRSTQATGKVTEKMLEVHQSSQESIKNTNHKYPFHKLHEGESFFVNAENCREDSLRSIVSNASNKYGKAFKCIKHTKSNVFEVACISKSKSEATTFNIVESSAEAKAFTDEGTGKKKYFFDQIPEGMSCLVPIESANEASLRVSVSIWSRKIQGRFMLLRHDQKGVFEIYHLPPSLIKSVEIVEPSPQAIEKGRSFTTACTDEIERRNCFLGRNPDDQNSNETTSYLPQPFLMMLTESEFLNLTCWLNDHIPSNTSILVSFSSLLQHIPSINRGSFAIKEATDIANLLGKMNIGIEPDPRFGDFVPKPEQDVVLFRIGDYAPTSPSTEYYAATVVLHLASAVASADGYIDPAEERHLEEHLEEWLHLSTDEKTRLRAHTQWLLSSFPGMNGVKERIMLLKQDQRDSLGRFLVGVAQADGYIDPTEIKMLLKIYEMLGLDTQSLYSHAPAAAEPDNFQPLRTRAAIARASWKHESAVEPITFQKAAFVRPQGYSIPTPPSKPTEGFSLDMSSIEAKLAETAAVSAILKDIFSEDAPLPPQTAVKESAATEISIAGLDAESFSFMQALATKHIWTRDELEILAADHSLMLDGTLDSINDASFDHFGGPFFEGDDPIEIDLEIVSRLGAIDAGL